MVSKLCSRSQGHPPGARKRAMMATARSNFAPVDTKVMYHSAHSCKKSAARTEAKCAPIRTRASCEQESTLGSATWAANSVVNLNFVCAVRHLLEESYLIQDCCWTL